MDDGILSMSCRVPQFVRYKNASKCDANEHPRVAAQATPLVSVHEPGRHDPSTRRQGPKFLLGASIKPMIEGEKLVVLVLAHARSFHQSRLDRLTVGPGADLLPVGPAEADRPPNILICRRAGTRARGQRRR